ncbi:MAG: YaaA family protein [Terriglobia bacterium]
MPVENLVTPTANSSKRKTIILVSCSHDKHSGGKQYDSSTRSISRTLTRTGKALLGKRREIASMLRHDKGYHRLYNKDQKGGYRDERECNRNLKLGPDLGGEETGGFYLPAHERYNGRFFSRLLAENPGFWKSLPTRSLEILFVSGLYGLVFWDELIQDYDCHFNDNTNEPSPRTVASICFDTLTASLCEVIKAYKSSSEHIYLFDLLSEETYQRLFTWDKVVGSGASVYHRVFKDFAGPDILAPLADILAREFPRFQGKAGFERGQWYSLQAGDSNFEYAFEKEVRSERDAVRTQFREKLLRDHTEFRTLSDHILN